MADRTYCDVCGRWLADPRDHSVVGVSIVTGTGGHDKFARDVCPNCLEQTVLSLKALFPYFTIAVEGWNGCART